MKEVGGRGKKAPYVSTHVRIPEPIKDKVERLKDLYVNGELEAYETMVEENQRLADEYKKSLTSNIADNNKDEQKTLTSLSEALEVAISLLKRKKSSKDTIAKLLGAIYGTEVSIDDLKF